MDFADLGSCATSIHHATSVTARIDDGDDGNDPCAPQILVPPRLNRLHPEWFNCIEPSDELEVTDPPRILYSVSTLGPTRIGPLILVTHATSTTQVAQSAVAGQEFEPVAEKDLRCFLGQDQGGQQTLSKDFKVMPTAKNSHASCPAHLWPSSIERLTDSTITAVHITTQTLGTDLESVNSDIATQTEITTFGL